MKHSKRGAALAMALGLASGAGMSGNAHGAYAESYLNITNFVISFEPAGSASVLGSSIPLSKANCNLFLPSPSEERCATGGIADADADVCNAPTGAPLLGENSFDTIGVQPTEYCNSDAWIPSQQTEGAPFTQAISIAEGNVTLADHSASGDSQNASTTSFAIEVASPTTMTLEFLADPFMKVVVQSDEDTGSVALAEITADATIVDNTVGSPTFGLSVFEWTPDGVVGTGISGGTEFADDADLSRNIQTVITDSSATYDPDNNGPPDGSLALPGVPLLYKAVTDELPVGSYTLSLAGEADIGVLRLEPPDELLGCRLTGGGVAIDDSTGVEVLVWDGVSLVDGEDVLEELTPPGVNRYQFGGQAGAHTALPPQPFGEWTHHQQRGPSGSFVFHGGTASAPAGTEIVEIRCTDPGGCAPSGNPPSPNKQLDFDGIGTFKNIGKGNKKPDFTRFGVGMNALNVTEEGHGNKTFDGTFHWFEVNVDDNGEGPDPAEGGSPACPEEGFGENGTIADSNCDCPDFYRITVYNGVDADTPGLFLPDGNIDQTKLNKDDVIYEAEGYLGLGGNGLQLHNLTGFDR